MRKSLPSLGIFNAEHLGAVLPGHRLHALPEMMDERETVAGRVGIA
jgi:hypothetical protein